jgi:parallel beta-helix repeat protein
MKISHILTLLSAFHFFSLTAFSQGSLTPPGAPTPTMKALDQVRSTGKAINSTNTPGDTNYEFVISSSGSYYLTGNLTVGKTNGISVTAPGVFIDLNGFEINRTTGIGGGDGVTITGDAHRCRMENGSIFGFSYGIHCTNTSSLPRGGTFRRLTVAGCSYCGLFSGDNWHLSACLAHDNDFYGIYANQGCVLEGCAAHSNLGNTAINAGDGSILTDCTAFNNQVVIGIAASTNSTLNNCSACANHTTAASSGIQAGSGCVLHNCTAGGNSSSGSSSYGIYAGACTISNCIAYGNTNTNGTLNGATGVGIYAGVAATITQCSAWNNTGDGIRVDQHCLVTGNNAYQNGNFGNGAGIHATASGNRIDGNNVTGNDRGIDVSGTGNIIVRNSARDNKMNGSGASTNYVIVANNRFAVVVDDTASDAMTVSGDSASGNLGTTSPWANIAY